MRVAISYAVEVDDDFRREINAYYGKPGMATREDVKRWFRSYGDSMNDDLGYQATVRAESEERRLRVLDDIRGVGARDPSDFPDPMLEP